MVLQELVLKLMESGILGSCVTVTVHPTQLIDAAQHVDQIFWKVLEVVVGTHISKMIWVCFKELRVLAC